MRPSLADGADLRRLRPLAAAGPAAAIAACLIDGGVVQLDPDDPQWADRDRLVCIEGAAADAVAARLHEHGADDPLVVGDSAGDALGLAVGMALISTRQGAVWRVWCVLDASASDDGAAWEAARAAAVAWPLPMVVLVAGAAGPMWDAAGWTVEVAPAADPTHLLAALDRAITSPGRPTLVAAQR